MSMEPEAREFLTRVGWSLSAGLIYLLINSTIGIAGGWLFFYDTPTLGNYIFYTWLLFSTVLLIWLMIRWWRRRFPHG